jgi:MOSC domain-containing protein YiiM
MSVFFPAKIEWRGNLIRTAIRHRVIARRLSLDGDEQAYLKGHGGERRAVMVYQLEAYRYWEC